VMEDAPPSEPSKLDREIDALFEPTDPYVPSSVFNQKLVLFRGDITQLEIESIVNAARPSLLGGGGIDKAIHRYAGPGLLQECRTLNGCKHSETKITKGYNLPCKYIFHTVGPNRDLHEFDESVSLLESTYLNLLDKMRDHGIREIAIPCISTGAYRFPCREAAHVALNSVRKWLEKEENSQCVDLIVFNVFLQSDYLIYTELLPKYFPIDKNNIFTQCFGPMVPFSVENLVSFFRPFWFQ